MTPRLRVLVIGERFWPEYGGWIGQTIRLLSLQQPDDTSFLLVVRAADRAGAQRLLPQAEIRQVGPAPRSHGFLGTLLFGLAASAYVLRNRATYDVLYLPISHYPAPLMLLCARLAAKPIVLRIAGAELGLKSISAITRKLLLRLADRVVVLNDDTRRLAIDAVGCVSKVALIPNGVDPQKYRPASAYERLRLRSDFGLDTADPVIVFVGSMCRRKGVHILLEACRILASSIPIRLVLAGPETGTTEADSAYTRALHELADSQPLRGKVLFLGRIDTVDRLLRVADVFVLPSTSEGMPNSLIEAMASGVPCIGTDIPGIRDIIEPDRTGLLVPPGDAISLAKAIYQIISDPHRAGRLAYAGRETITASHSADVMACRYRALFWSVFTERSQSYRPPGDHP